MWNHGLTGYRIGCKCDPCREAGSVANKKQRKRAEQRWNEGGPAAFDQNGHGRYSTYQLGCKCPDCKADMARYKREWRQSRKVKAT